MAVPIARQVVGAAAGAVAGSPALPSTLLPIRPLEPSDWPAVWALLQPVFRAGETFPHDPAIAETEARALWVDQTQAVRVAIDAAGAVVGSYYLKANSLCLGAHVAHAGYVVAESCRRQGIGSRLCQDSLQRARSIPSSAAVRGPIRHPRRRGCHG